MSRKLKISLIIIIVFIVIIIIYNLLNLIRPKGISIDGRSHKVENIEFLYDLTYMKNGEISHEQVIFDRVFKMIENANKFIVIDMFLFNNDYDKENIKYPEISKKLTDALIKKSKENSEIDITFITDPVNTFYGSYDNSNIEKLRENNIEVVITNLNKLRDSNPSYSMFWKIFFRIFGTYGRGWLPNAFSSDSPKVTLRSYLKLMNFKANHRKIIVTEEEAMVLSANPHDASAYHSNIAFVVKGEILADIIKSEENIVKFSKGNEIYTSEIDLPEKSDRMQVRLITEGKIAKSICNAIKKSNNGSIIKLGVFYLSDRKVIKELISASKRNADIEIILDANKDAFGRTKNGVPNRPVAYELMKKSNEKIKIRWYHTNGEQFHTKLLLVKNIESSIIIGGSANFTRRNIRDFNLETNIEITSPSKLEIVRDVENYFERIWNNEDGNYTIDYNKYSEKSKLKTIMYRFCEWSGISTF